MAEESVETISFSIESGDQADTVSIPATLVDLLSDGDQSPPETVGDIALLSFASRAHHIVHHDDDDDPELERAESAIMDIFEERFGVSYAEATGHHH